MGKLINGKWLNDEKLKAFEAEQYKTNKGKFVRGTAQFRSWITKDGSAGASGEAGFKAEKDRYHLFAALNCPWAHRTLIYRKIKGLDRIISLSLVNPLRNDDGWFFHSNGRFSDLLYGLKNIHSLYTKADPNYTGRATVPVLWDKQKQTIVSTESSEIIRMFDLAFEAFTSDKPIYFIDDYAEQINSMNDFVYTHLNNGVYQAGFARDQSAYNEAVTKVFAGLDKLESILENSTYLLGETITEADWRLLPTLVRFDVGYYSAFKCNLKAIRDYPNLSRYLQALLTVSGVSDTIDLEVYRKGYHSKNELRNPYGIVPKGLKSQLNLAV